MFEKWEISKMISKKLLNKMTKEGKFCKHSKPSEKEVGYDLDLGVKEYYCSKCQNVIKQEKIKEIK